MHIRSPTIPSWRRWVSRVWESERDLWTKEISSNSGAAKIWKFFFQYFSAKQTVPSGKLISLLFMEINVIKNKIKYLDNNFYLLGMDEGWKCAHEDMNIGTFYDFSRFLLHKNTKKLVNKFLLFVFNNGKRAQKIILTYDNGHS